MPFLHVVQALDMNSKSREELLRELNFLRTEIDDIRAKMVTLLGKLDAETLAASDYVTTCSPAASVFTKL